VRGLPVLIQFVALSGYRRPGIPKGCLYKLPGLITHQNKAS